MVESFILHSSLENRVAKFSREEESTALQRALGLVLVHCTIALQCCEDQTEIGLDQHSGNLRTSVSVYEYRMSTVERSYSTEHTRRVVFSVLRHTPSAPPPSGALLFVTRTQRVAIHYILPFHR